MSRRLADLRLTDTLDGIDIKERTVIVALRSAPEGAKITLGLWKR
jgi:hypothetical protein